MTAPSVLDNLGDFALIERPLTERIAAASLPRTKAMLDVFRFAWSGVRTFAGVIALILVLYAGMWVFVKIPFGGDSQRGSGRRAAARDVVQRAGNRA